MDNHLLNHLIQKTLPHKPTVEDPSTLKEKIDILCKYVSNMYEHYPHDAN